MLNRHVFLFVIEWVLELHCEFDGCLMRCCSFSRAIFRDFFVCPYLNLANSFMGLIKTSIQTTYKRKGTCLVRFWITSIGRSNTPLVDCDKTLQSFYDFKKLFLSYLLIHSIILIFIGVFVDSSTVVSTMPYPRSGPFIWAKKQF